jgi:hypothetical protein
MEPTDATIIGVYFLNYTESISTCFGHYYAHHQETRKRDWLTIHVKLPGCAGCSCMVLRCGQYALLESCCSSFLKVQTAHVAAPYNCSQHNQVASHEVLTSLVSLSPDDGYNNARNM